MRIISPAEAEGGASVPFRLDITGHKLVTVRQSETAK
jgi:hypothetical protein